MHAGRAQLVGYAMMLRLSYGATAKLVTGWHERARPTGWHDRCTPADGGDPRLCWPAGTGVGHRVPPTRAACRQLRGAISLRLEGDARRSWTLRNSPARVDAFAVLKKSIKVKSRELMAD